MRGERGAKARVGLVSFVVSQTRENVSFPLTNIACRGAEDSGNGPSVSGITGIGLGRVKVLGEKGSHAR